MKNAIFENELQRIKISEKIIVITLIALASDTVAFQQGVALIKSNPTLLASFLTTAASNLEEGTQKLMFDMTKKKATGFLSGIIGTTVMDREILKVIINTLSTISSFVQPSNSLFSLLHMLYQENNIYSDCSPLAQSKTIILTRLKVRKNISYFLEKIMCELIKIR